MCVVVGFSAPKDSWLEDCEHAGCVECMTGMAVTAMWRKNEM